MKKSKPGRPAPEIPRGSRIKALDPKLNDGLLRVGVRLRAALELSFDEKHPIILDGRNPITRLIVRAHYTTPCTPTTRPSSTACENATGCFIYGEEESSRMQTLSREARATLRA